MCAKVRSIVKMQPVKRTSSRIAAAYSNKIPDSSQQSESRKTGKISIHQSIIHRRQTRNQSVTKKLINCVAKESASLQNTQKLSIPQIQQQQNVESEAGTLSNNVVDSDDDCDIDYLGRPPSVDPSDSNEDTDGDETDDSTEKSKRPGINRERLQKLTKIDGLGHSDMDTGHVAKDTSELENTSELVIPRSTFQNLVREIMQQQQKDDFRMQSTTLECLQAATEQILIQYFEDINSVPDSPQTLVEARMKFMVMNYYLNFMQKNE
ncbi:uncharacterized protein LOC129579020 [Sitodiplosis mosellana]|uniref:uncharacterized protein LOC129579020 n=1 Tax=Sitodiplosis mosellana TaxID=263140 RepID=UPI00244469AF|nr:uncharacterized protein LOC129579020 [Sitodiplosis mosellana]